MTDALASLYRRGNYSFVPLVREQFKPFCSLDILFLRPNMPGSAAVIDVRINPYRITFASIGFFTAPGHVGGGKYIFVLGPFMTIVGAVWLASDWFDL